MVKKPLSIKSLAPQVKPSLWWFSNMVVLGGSLMYARVRQLEMAKAPPAPSRSENKVDLEKMENGEKEAPGGGEKVQTALP